MTQHCQSCRKACTCWRECLCMTLTEADGVPVCHDCADELPVVGGWRA